MKDSILRKLEVLWGMSIFLPAGRGKRAAGIHLIITV